MEAQEGLRNRRHLCGPRGPLTKPGLFLLSLSSSVLYPASLLGFLRDGQVGLRLWEHLQLSTFRPELSERSELGRLWVRVSV